MKKLFRLVSPVPPGLIARTIPPALMGNPEVRLLRILTGRRRSQPTMYPSL